MWEEDPRWQNAQFRVLAVGVLLLVLLRLGAALAGWDWEPKSFDWVMLGLGLALMIYGAAVWTFGWVFRFTVRWLGKKAGRSS